MNKHVIFGLWVVVIAGALYVYFFRNDLFLAGIALLTRLPLVWRYWIYLILGCLRGFTFIPVTYLILLGLVGLAGYFERHYPRQIAKLKFVMRKNELPIVISWSFFPFTPTDVMCYMCGSLRIDFKKFFFGVLVGEGISCAIYIFVGKELLLFLLHKLIGA